jgi:hypothetical protein
MGVFNKIFAGLAAKAGKPYQLMIEKRSNCCSKPDGFGMQTLV